MWSWQTVVPLRGPCGMPFTVSEQAPQIPSRQSLSKAIGSSPFSSSSSFSSSSISRNDMSGFTSTLGYVTRRPASCAFFWRQTWSVSFMEGDPASSLVGAGREVDELELERLLVEEIGLVVALPLPAGDVAELVVVA